MINYGHGVVLTPDIPQKAREWRNDPEIYKWCRQLEPIREWEHEAWLEIIKSDPSIRMYGIREGDGDTPCFGIPHKGRDIGVCGFTSIDSVNQKAEFSLYIAPNYQGQGYGKAALKTLIDHGFRALNLNRIWGEVFEGNPALEIDKKIGFTVEGKLRETYFKDGKFIDSYLVSILRQEWFGSRLASSGCNRSRDCLSEPCEPPSLECPQEGSTSHLGPDVIALIKSDQKR